MDALGARKHVQQAEVAVVAASKDDVGRLLAGAHADSRVTDRVHLVRGREHAGDLALLLRYRAITMDEPAVYAWESMASGNPVIRIDGDWYEVAGRFLYRPTGGPMTVALPGPEDPPMPLVPAALSRPVSPATHPVAPGRTRDNTAGSATPSRGEGE
jgi:hypothetical protein